MRKAKEGEYRSRVYTDRPMYADYEAPAKFQAIESIIARRLKQHPNAICSYSGGSDSDVLIDLIERVRRVFSLGPVKYVFFNTGLEMEATRRHVKEIAEKYGVEIQAVRPKVNVVQATRKYGLPFVSKIMSAGLEAVQAKGIPLEVHDEYWEAEDKEAKTTMCFTETADGQYRLRPLYYASDADKAWYKEYYGLRYSDAYEVYGFKRTGCCGCSISAHATEDLELLKPYEPNLYKAAWNVFGDSYRYRQKYNAYRAMRNEQKKEEKKWRNKT